MDKKSISFIVICFILLVFWPRIIDQFYPRRPIQKPAPVSTEPESKEALDTPPGVSSPETRLPDKKEAWKTDSKKSAPAPAPAPTPKIPEAKYLLENNTLRLVLSNYGGGINSVTLKKHFNHYWDRSENDAVVLNLVYINEEQRHVPAFSLRGLASLPANAPFEAESSSDQISFTSVSATGLQIKKTFILQKESEYDIQLEIELTNNGLSPAPLSEAAILLGQMSPQVTHEEARYTGFDWLSGGNVTHKKVTDIPDKPFEIDAPISWAAIKNQFFIVLLDAKANPGDSLLAKISPVQSNVEKKSEMAAFMGLTPQSLAPGQSLKLHYSIFAGPKDFKILQEMGDQKVSVMEFDIFYIFFPIKVTFFGYITQMLLSLLISINGYVHNYGLAIIIVTILIKALFWYPSSMATASMKKMQILSPKMQALRDKYKDNPMKLNEEMMKLYREYKFNPLGGCLPGLLQIPVFFAFYIMLQSAVELRGAHFLWIKDLSQPDTIAVIPLIGLPINPLPLLMAGTMFWQMHMTPTSGDPMQKKIFMFMPFMMLLFVYNFSSGLSLYWTVQNLISILQLWLSLRKKDEPLTPAKV